MTQFLQIEHSRDFDKNILPKIDELAAEQGRNRPDIIRDILYAQFSYIPMPRSQDQINEDHVEEPREETKVKNCIETAQDLNTSDLAQRLT
jgi:hypothetical protein